jgi:hypothetical protein
VAVPLDRANPAVGAKRSLDFSEAQSAFEYPRLAVGIHLKIVAEPRLFLAVAKAGAMLDSKLVEFCKRDANNRQET